MNLLLVIEGDIATTQIIEQVLGACRAFNVEYRKAYLDRLRAADFDGSVVPLFVRCGDPAAAVWMRALATAQRPFLYYIDDNFWRIVGTSGLATYYRHPVVRQTLEFAVATATKVLTSSTELANFLERFGARTVVLPTHFDFSLIAAAQPPALPPDEVRIGFAGSLSRVNDLDIIAPIVGQVLERFPQAVFEFIGAAPRRLKPGARVRFFPYAGDYAAYVRFQMQRGWAIGLAPLADHEANRGKTDNKYREYGAFRCAGVYSAIPPYTRVVKPGLSGVLVENTPEAWYDAVVALLSDPIARAAIAEHAFDDVEAHYRISAVASHWATAVSDTAAHAVAKPIDKRGLDTNLRRARFARLRPHLAAAYHEGGAVLVGKRLLGKALGYLIAVAKAVGRKVRRRERPGR